jgi:hypothetical protein
MVNLFYGNASDGFPAWVKRCPQVVFRTDRTANGLGWNVKPYVLMKMLDEGFDEVMWLDSDLIVNQNPFETLASIEKEVLVATEDALGEDRADGNAIRAQLWGFRVGRTLPFGLNSAVVRVSKDHYPLLDCWWNLLQDKTYQHFQKKGWRNRPVHMLGDQDVLTALLTSEQFSGIPLHVLRRGKDILQFNGIYGYTVAERMRNLLGNRPMFIHSFAAKPWSDEWRPESIADLSNYIKKIYVDLSPFTISALRFRDDLDCDTAWMDAHYMLSRILRALGMGNPAFVGLPIAIFADIACFMKNIRKSDRSSILANYSILEAGRHEVTDSQ